MAKAAFDYKHINDAAHFNVALETVKFRNSLSKRERSDSPDPMPKLKKAKIVLTRVDDPTNGPSSTPAPDVVPSSSDATTVILPGDDSKNSSKYAEPDDKSSDDNSSDDNEPEVGTSKSPDKSPRSSPESPPPADEEAAPSSPMTRSQAKNKKSNYEELLQLAMTGGGTLNEIIAGLNTMLAEYTRGRRKTKRVKNNIDQVNNLIIILYKSQPADSWKDELMKYADVLKLM